MLSNAFEWERLVHPNPTDDMVTRRTAIVTSILASFDSDQDVNQAVRLVSAAITGLSPTIQADVDYATILTEATKKHQQAFPSQLSENALDLQLTACLAVGEILTRKPGKGSWREPLSAIAAISKSSFRLQPKASGAHLQSVQEVLVTSSDKLLARHALNARKRSEVDLSELENLEAPADVPTFWNQLKPILENAFDSLTSAADIDRDELEVLWWLYNDTSSIFDQGLSELTAFDVAFASAVELIDRALCPAPASLLGIINGLVARVAGNSKSTGKGIRTVLGSWTPAVLTAFAPTDEETRDIVKGCPKVLPLTWIAIRVAESGEISGWEKEFTARTGIEATVKVIPQTLAEQVLNERTSQRLLHAIIGE